MLLSTKKEHKLSAIVIYTSSTRGLYNLQLKNQKNHLNSLAAGPSRSRCVGTSLTLILTPSRLSLARLSSTIQNPSAKVRMKPIPPKAAVVASAGMYFGASWALKMFELTTPIRFAIGTPKLVNTTRFPSCAILLLYQTSRSTDGAEVPHVIMNAAK